MAIRKSPRRLFRSPRTIEHHVSSLLAKLNASGRMDAVLESAQRALAVIGQRLKARAEFSLIFQTNCEK